MIELELNGNVLNSVMEQMSDEDKKEMRKQLEMFGNVKIELKCLSENIRGQLIDDVLYSNK